MEYKPLCELSNDGVSVRAIFKTITNVYPDNYSTCKNKVSIHGTLEDDSFVDMHIWFDGEVFLEQNGQDVGISDPFEFVDAIRSLGYSKRK